MNGTGCKGMSLSGSFGVRLCVAFFILAKALPTYAQSVSIGSGAAMVQDFDTLATTGDNTNTAMPSGWYFVENDAAGLYSAGDGNGLSGGVYSFGTGANSERALGGLRSNSTDPKFGARLQNDTGAVLPEVRVTYTGEQWRLGVTNRVPVDQLHFQYSLDATSLSTGAWVDVDALDLISPNPAGVAGAHDGNLAINRATITAVISGLSIAPGAGFWVRWTDPNASGNDDGLAIDNASFGVTADVPPVVASTSPLSAATNVAVSSNLIVTFSEPVNTDPGAFTLSCPSNASYPITVSGTGNNRTIDPNVNFAFGETCTATVVAANVNDLDGTLDDMLSNYSWSFTTIADTAPTIASTLPAAGATGVAVNALVTINFSEPVNTTNPWLVLTCNSVIYSGALTPSNANATWTLDPASNFINGETCTAQITGANVLDTDGVPNALAGNPTFSFTIAADVAPTISSTYPVNLDVNVPAASNLTAVFSEPVNVQAGAFSINCVVSGAHPFVQTDSAQTQYTLNPNSDFSLSESCTLAIIGSLISDIDGVANPVAGNTQINFTVGAGVAAYYDRVDPTSCRSLRATLHGVIDDHTAFPYSSAATDTWDILEAADQDPLNAARILDVYQNCSYAKGGDRVGGAGTGATCVNTTGTRNGIRFNREHTWPNSRGFNDITDLDGFAYAPYTDTHMLFASDEIWNADRGSKPYANCSLASGCSARETTAYNGQGGGPVTYPGNHNWVKSGAGENFGSFETFNFRKGDTARAQFYMAIRFEGGRNSRNFQREPDLELTDDRNAIISTASGVFSAVGFMGMKADLLGWHAADPVTPAEGIRNDLIESYQGNRNPFVDHPEWIAPLFGASCTGPAFVAVEDDFFGTEDIVLNRNGANDIGVLNDDHVYEGAALTVNTVPVTLPLHGGVVLSSNGQFVYTPTGNYCGKDSFVYSVSNGTLTDSAIAHIDLACTNDQPVAVGSISNSTVNVGSAASIATAPAFNDVDGDALVYSVSAAPALPASIDINAATGLISGTPLIDDVGVYNVVVRATEPAPLTGFVTQAFTLTISNDTGAIFRNGFE
jgi:endonuclease I